MDFFEHQDHARRNTRRLVLLFFLAVVAVVVAVNLAVLAIFFWAESQTDAQAFEIRPEVALWVTAATVAVILIGSLYKTAVLSGGGEKIAQMLGGRPLESNTQDLNERRLLNVVEEMALASGIPAPAVFLLDKERSINAFAAGFSPETAVIGVTRGTLELLSRDELQGVVAHEFSHILNGDMRLNIRLMGILHGILIIGLIGYWVLRSSPRSSDRKKGGGAVMLLGLALFVIGYVGVFFGKLIKSGVSRQREFLADSAAVQFTRNPPGIAGALKKIGGLASSATLKSPNAEQASHLFFGNGVGRTMFRWLGTHPPLEERIRRLEPGFDGTFPEIRAAMAKEAPVAQMAPDATRAAPTAPRPEPAVQAPTLPLAPDEVGDLVGNPTPVHLAYAQGLLQRLPDDLHSRAREPAGARALVCALLLDPDGEIRRRQLKVLFRDGDRLLRQEIREALPGVDACTAEARLPLLDLAIPALRRLSSEQYSALKKLVEGLIAADRRVSLFEYTLQRLLLRHLEPSFRKVKPTSIQFYSLKKLGAECSVLLSALAHAGHSDAEEAGKAFACGAERLAESDAKLALRPRDGCGISQLDQSLRRLVTVAPRLKRQLLEACTATIGYDRRVTLAEGELLRAVADALECPLPPLLAGEELAA
jgi:Zn-dependent protease with chaperone function